MTSKPSTKPWRDFERYVANLYQELGAIEIAHDINICGNQIDVFAVVPSYDGSHIKTIISCKHYTGVVGVGAVREWNQIFRALFDAREADRAVIVSNDGFTQDAQRFAADTGIRLTTIDRLRWASCDFVPYLKARASEFGAEPLFAQSRYIPLRLRIGSKGDIQDAQTSVKNFLGAVGETLLILLGDFGTGKTTFSKHLFQSLAAEFLTDPAMNRMPIHVNLREYPGHLNLSSLITDLLVNQYRARCPSFSSVERLQREGKLVIIFDAFDEMASRTDYQTTLQNFHALERLIIGTGKVILTCRTHYFKDQEEVSTVYGGTELYKISQQNKYTIAYVQGFEPEQIDAYVRAVCGKDAPKYLKQIKETYNLQGLAQRPILLDMITEVLPSLMKKGQAANSATLYALYVDFWLKRDDWRTTLSKQDRLHFTTAFAIALYNAGAEVFKWDDVEKAIRTRWPESTKKELEHYQYDIRTCSFIRWEPKRGDYSFVHQSFMEYFVASRLYEGTIHNDKQVLLARNHTDGVLHFLSEFKATEQTCSTLLTWLRSSASDILVRNALVVLRKWRPELQKQDFTRIRITEMTLPGFGFTNCTFAACLLSSLHLQENRWLQCQLSDSNIVSCRWTSGTLNEVRIQRCLINATSFNKTELQSVEFAECELNDVALSVANTASRFDGCRLRGCSFEKWTGAGSRFVNCSFTDVRWSFPALDGAEFDGGSFLSGSELLLSIKQEFRGWTKPPVFRQVSGLGREVRHHLSKLGAKFPKKIRPKMPKRRIPTT